MLKVKDTMPKGKKIRYRTVRILGNMVDAIEEFLQTEDAKRMGFVSKSAVVTTAVRELLIKYGHLRKKSSEDDRNAPPAKFSQ